MAHILEVEGNKMGFSRSYRASIDRIRGITFTVPKREMQDNIINMIEEIEQKISEAEKKIEDLSEKKASILNHYLN